MKDYRVYADKGYDEFLIGESNDLDEACRIARDEWDTMCDADKRDNVIRVIRFLRDIDDEDCTCFDYNTYDWFRWYAVTLDEEDNDHGYGSFDWYEAYDMAGRQYEQHPGVRIVTVDYRTDDCIEEELYEDIRDYMEIY